MRWTTVIRKTWLLLMMICVAAVLRVAMLGSNSALRDDPIERSEEFIDNAGRDPAQVQGERIQTPKGKRALNSCQGKRAPTRGVAHHRTNPREVIKVRGNAASNSALPDDCPPSHGSPSRKSKCFPKSEGMAGALMMAMALSSTMQPAKSATSGRKLKDTWKVHWPSWLIKKSIAQEEGPGSNAKLQYKKGRTGIPALVDDSETIRVSGTDVQGQDQAY